MKSNSLSESVISFNRESNLKELQTNPRFDIIIIGGGATGLGVALDSASRGFRTLLLEQADFAKGTSSRSTKLIHGGVRYLGQGDIKLVYEALFERGILLKNAPHIVNMQPFVIPSYKWWEMFLYGIGLKVYDWMAWRYRFPKTRLLGRKAVEELLPNVRKSGLIGGVLYYDGQFDDARLAVNIAQTSAGLGAVLINYMRVTDLLKGPDGRICGVRAVDAESGTEYVLNSKAVINATGVFVDDVLKMNTSSQEPMVRPSQGVHITLDLSFLEGKNALMIPSTEDGRVLFAVPWHNHLLVGTTDTPLEKHSLEPVALEDEIDFILKTLRGYLLKKPQRKDVLSVFAGLRPLAAQGSRNGATKEISRSHKLVTSSSGLVTITGGKWTTYRKMAEDTVDEAIRVAGLGNVECPTTEQRIHGSSSNGNDGGHLQLYGSDAAHIRALTNVHPELSHKLHEAFPYTGAEVVWAVRYEMARTVEDVLARRLRILFLNAAVAMEMAPEVARLMADELHKDYSWQEAQITAFSRLAEKYLATVEHGATTGK